jgi:hypothetical protein
MSEAEIQALNTELAPVEVPEAAPAPEPAAESHRLRNTLGKAALIPLAAGTILSGDHAPSSGFYESPYHAPAAEVTIPAQAPGENPTTLHFSDLRDADAFSRRPTSPHIQPGPFLQRFTTTQDPFMKEIGLLPVKIDDPAKFATWVKGQTKREDIRKEAGLDQTSDENATPQQLVNLAADIVTANSTYDYSGEPSKNYGKPMDENLEKNNPLQCEGHSAATIAVYDIVKRNNPVTLAETYMVSYSSTMMGHEWNAAIQVTGENEAQVAFVDSTSRDTSYSEGPTIHLDAVQLIEGLTEHEKNLIDDKTARKLGKEYYDSPVATEHDKFRLDNDLQLQFPPQ